MLNSTTVAHHNCVGSVPLIPEEVVQEVRIATGRDPIRSEIAAHDPTSVALSQCAVEVRQVGVVEIKCCHVRGEGEPVRLGFASGLEFALGLGFALGFGFGFGLASTL